MQVIMKCSLVVMAFLLAESKLRAEDFDLAIEAITSVDPDRTSPLMSWVTFLLVSLLVLTISAAFISDSHRSTKVHELFLPIKIRGIEGLPAKISRSLWKRGRFFPKRFWGRHIASPAGDQTVPKTVPAHLRDLSSSRATIVISAPIHKGQRIRIDLESLPGFEDILEHRGSEFKRSHSKDEYMVTGEVKNCRPQNGDQVSYMAGIKFIDLPKDSRDILEKYVNKLKFGGQLRSPYSLEPLPGADEPKKTKTTPPYPSGHEADRIAENIH